MHSKYLDILCCPHSRSPLRLEEEEVSSNGMIESGVLVSATGDYRYPIVNRVPRFLGAETYAESFGYEWQKWSRVQFDSENVGRPMAGHTERMFDAITGFSPEFLSGRVVVEFGCGAGRFLDVARRRNAIAIGIDMSRAVDAARKNFANDEDVLIVQGDILNPPFRDLSFDAGYSIGVFHHTPDPEGAFNKLVNVVKPNGPVACCVYPKGGLYDLPSVAVYRRIHNAIKPFVGNTVALGYSYVAAHFLYKLFSRWRRHVRGQQLVAYLERHLFVNVDIPDVRWRILDVFDAITPSFASTHTAEDVMAWFQNARCREVTQKPWGSTAFAGIKEGDG